MSDKEFLNWVADRLVNVYKESDNVDFVIKLRKIASRSKSPLVGTDKRSLASFISTFKSKRGEHFAGYQSLVDELSEAICKAYQEGKLNAKP